MKPIIEVKNISKKYIISHRLEKYYTLRETLTNLVKVPLKMLKQKRKAKKEEFWALKDINFSVLPGETIGIIGRNGAGKSTLLKILSQITPPTSGLIHMRGRVASLLEVGTGFHPELTGRENIFLNGSILGMKRWEIRKKFNEIVAFAEIEKFLDTPVKRYSSGMFVRLAFAVAAHLEPEILIVDEVLAVGDIQFQKKCLGKMDEIAKQQGRTVLFVSHNLGAIRSLCAKGILLESGKLKFFGDIDKTITSYQKTMHDLVKLGKLFPIHSINNTIDILDFSWINTQGTKVSFNNSADAFRWSIKFKLLSQPKQFNIVIALENDFGQRVVAFTSSPSLNSQALGINKPLELTGSCSDISLAPGRYNCAFGVRFNNETVLYVPQLNFIDIKESISNNFDGQNGSVYSNTIWKINK